MIIGITGGLATGTSTAARYIAACLKAKLIDADKFVHDILGNDAYACRQITSRFSGRILNPRGAIDRKKLAAKVFNKRKNMEKLCAIVHPIVLDKIARQIEYAYRDNPRAFIVVDGPVLIESNFYKRCDCVVLVAASLALELERAKRFKHIDIKDAISRISLQMPPYEKARYADFIIDNNAGLKELKQNCVKVAKMIQRKKRGGKANGGRK